MSKSSNTDSADLKITGHEVADHTIPIDILVRVLSGLQQTVYLLAASREEHAVKRRFRPDAGFRLQHKLRCGQSKESSYLLPLALPEPAAHLFSPLLSESQKSASILEDLHELLQGVASASERKLNDVFPDSMFRERALRQIRSFLPRRGQSWALEFSVPSMPSMARLDWKAVATIDTWFQRQSGEAQMTITGRLVRIDFDKKTLFLNYAPSHREIECVYTDDLEETLFEERRNLIQVTGTFTVDSQGVPEKIRKVLKIEELDLSPIEMFTVEYAGRKLSIDPPLQVVPALDESEQLLTALVGNIGLDVFAPTREELVDEVSEQIFFLWDTYALSSDEDLTESARKLKFNLLAQLEDITHAPQED
jgi:hypothetical protein